MKVGAITIGTLGLTSTVSAGGKKENEKDEKPDETELREYVIGVTGITDMERYTTEYLPGAAETVTEYGGEPLVVSFDPEVVEGEWDHSITIVVEFPSEEAAKAWYNDETYQELSQIRDEFVEYHHVIFASQFDPEALA